MPSLRTTAVRKRRTIEVSDMAFAFMADDPGYESREGDPFEVLHLRYPDPRNGEYTRAWQAVGAEIMGWWPERHPGTRPKAWWELEAPRWADDPWTDCWYHGTFAEPRRRLGGTGTAIFECLAYKPEFDFGVPTSFLDAWDFAYYAEHMDGLENSDHPDEVVEAYDPADPPVYESQARYLLDKGLLEPAERKIVKKLGLLDDVEVVQGPYSGGATE